MVGKSITYNGYKYWRAKKGKDSKYYKRISRGRVIYLHRQVFADVHGPIPKNHEVHHINGNTHDNRAENLEAVLRKPHKKKHRGTCSPAMQSNLDNIRPLTKAWHGSEEGREWHSQNARAAYQNREPISKECVVCGKRFDDITRRDSSVFCSNACKSKNRRSTKADHIEKNCPVCQSVFTTNKYRPAATCSRGCANTYRAQKK